MDKQSERANVMLGGREYVIVPRDEYLRLAGLMAGVNPPALPSPDSDGHYPASEYMTASLARKLIKGRIEAGLTQRALARLVGITLNNLSRIESGDVTPTLTTVTKIDAALKKAAKGAARVKRGGRKASKTRA